MLNKQGDNIQSWCTPFPIWNQAVVSCAVSECCFLSCILDSQEAGNVVWYSHQLKNFPQCVMIRTVKGFSLAWSVKQKRMLFCNSVAFLMIHWMLAIWCLVPLPFLNPAWTSGSSWFTYCWSLAWRILSNYFASMWDECNCAVVQTFFAW